MAEYARLAARVGGFRVLSFTARVVMPSGFEFTLDVDERGLLSVEPAEEPECAPGPAPASPARPGEAAPAAASGVRAGPDGTVPDCPALPPEPRLSDTERAVVAALRAAGRPLKGSAVARRMGREYNPHFRGLLATLVRLGVLVRGEDGYEPRATRTGAPGQPDGDTSR